MLLHIVALRFKPSLSDAQIERHFREEVNLKARMPGIVLDWAFSKNASLVDRADKNRSMNYIVLVYLKDEAALAEYIPHPEHVAVKTIQGPLVEDIVPLDMHLTLTMSAVARTQPLSTVGYTAFNALKLSLLLAMGLALVRR
jgi:hypothetical protein